MSKIIAWLKNIRPIKILTVLCIGVLLIVTQACGSVTAEEPKASNEAKTEVQAKTEALKQNAEQNLIDKPSSLDENTLGNNLQQSAEDAKDKIGNTAEDFAKGVERGIENIKDNTQDAAEDLTINAQRAADDAKTNVQRTAQDAGDAINRAVN